MFQHANYLILAFGLGFILPTIIASLWGDAWGGLFFAAHVSQLIIWHATFSINSLAHWIGNQDFSLETTAKSNFLLALITFGEG